ncbi:hypothetical protein [Chryseobacterium lactis]|uniref:hypothetical protein n=1 Tax=Chryseobacterium lactis TaxID=1241981 RepID=UPI001626AD06|nr:hypothetical protein [Chryseobacterium lactis]
MVENISRILIDFNENKKRENLQFFFKHKWKKSSGELRKVIIYTILFLSLGFLPFFSHKIGQPSVIFRYGGFMFLGYIFLLVYQYFTTKNTTYKLIEQQINDYTQQEKKESSIILNKEVITIEDPFNTIGSTWSRTNYKIIDQFLILNVLNNRLSFIFTKSEFKNSDYEILIDFLQKYSKLEN